MVADGPLIFVQSPVPGEGLFPASVIEVNPELKHWSEPAFARMGPVVLITLAVIELVADPQPLATVHVKV